MSEQNPKNEEIRVGVFVCNCGVNIAGFLDTKAVADYAATLPNVVFVKENLFSCSEAGISDIKKAIIDNKLNRVVVAACTPRTHEPTFRAACEDAGLNPYYFEFVNIREHVSWVHKEDREAGTSKAKDLIRMGVARVIHLEPLEPISGKVTPRALVIGGGVSGLTASLELSRRGFEVILVEKEKDLGGLLRSFDLIYPWKIKAKDYVSKLTRAANKDPRIRIYTESEVKDVKGYIGNYSVLLSSEKEPITVGIIIVATGARPLIPEGLYHYDGKKVITQFELEKLLASGRVRAKDVVIMTCVGARGPERVYCSRICCMTALKNAIALRKKRAAVTILYRDLMCYGIRNEEVLREAKKAGVRFINFADDEPPAVEKETIRVSSKILGRELTVKWDLLVLSTPLVPQETNDEISRLLKVPVDEYGFFLEAHVKLRPLDFATDGIFVCGTARWPASVEECVEQSLGAAARASTFLMKGEVKVEPIVSEVVDEESCRGCGLCAAVCPYGAIEIVETEKGKKAKTIEVACKGCGTCGATCYRRVLRMKHYTDEQILAQVKAAFSGEE